MAGKSAGVALFCILLLYSTPGALAYAQFREYKASTNVVGRMRLDLDLAEMNANMQAWRNSDNVKVARRVYEEGGHACTHAEVTLQAPLGVALAVGEILNQGRDGDWSRKVRVRASAGTGAQSVIVEYSSVWRPCFGGGSNETYTLAAYSVARPLKWHCLDTVSPLQNAQYADVAVPSAVDDRFESLAALSMTADARMRGEPTFDLLKSFHGSGDFAHQFLLNTFDSSTGRTFLPAEMGRGAYTNIAIPHIIVFMTMWTEVVHQMERSVFLCQDSDTVDDSDCVGAACEQSALHAWDKAAAYYAGSSWASFSDSLFLDGQANQICFYFGTCDPEDRIAQVNEKIYSHLGSGQRRLLAGSCEDLAAQRDIIIKQMYVPLVQGLLQWAYTLATSTDIRRDRVKVALYARTLQPKLEQCDDQFRSVLQQNVFVADDAQPMSAGYPAFKAQVEAVYPCLGVTCNDVGGILDLNNEGSTKHLAGAEPCSWVEVSAEESSEFPIVPFVFAIIGVCCCGCALVAAWSFGFNRGRRYERFEFGNGGSVKPTSAAPSTFGSART